MFCDTCNGFHPFDGYHALHVIIILFCVSLASVGLLFRRLYFAPTHHFTLTQQYYVILTLLQLGNSLQTRPFCHHATEKSVPQLEEDTLVIFTNISNPKSIIMVMKKRVIVYMLTMSATILFIAMVRRRQKKEISNRKKKKKEGSINIGGTEINSGACITSPAATRLHSDIFCFMTFIFYY